MLEKVCFAILGFVLLGTVALLGWMIWDVVDPNSASKRYEKTLARIAEASDGKLEQIEDGIYPTIIMCGKVPITQYHIHYVHQITFPNGRVWRED